MYLRNRFALARAPMFLCDTADPPAPGPNPPPPNNPPPPPPPAPRPPEPVAATPEARVTQLERALGDVRAEAAAHRISEREAREAVATLTTQLTATRAEIETRVAATRQEFEPRMTALTNRTIDAELRAAAVAAGLVDVDLLPLIKRDGIAMDADGVTIKGIPDAIAAFKTAKPSYFRDVAAPPPAPPVRTGPGAPPPAPAPGGPAPTNVSTLDRAAYKAAKSAQLAALRN